MLQGDLAARPTATSGGMAGGVRLTGVQPASETVAEAGPPFDAGETVPVAFVSSHSTRGGSERYLALLLEQMNPVWISTVVCLDEGPLADELRSAGLPVEVIATERSGLDVVRAARRLRQSLRRAGSAVVHANGVKLLSSRPRRRSAPLIVYLQAEWGCDAC